MNQSCMMTSLRKVSQIFSYKVDLGKYAKTCCTSVFSLFIQTWSFGFKQVDGSQIATACVRLCIKMVLDSMDETLKCDYSYESYWAVFSCVAVYYAVQGGSNFWFPG